MFLEDAKIRKMKNLVNIILSILIWALLCQVAWASDWYVYESKNFRLVADKKRKYAAKELHDLELFRQATLLFTNIEHLDEKSRLTILVLDKSKNYLAIFPEKKAAGFYVDSFSGPYMVVGPSESIENSAMTLRHEYVHHLLHSASDNVYPKWYDEGLADLLSTARITTNSVAIGAPHPWRTPFTGMGQILSFNDLITPSNFFRDGIYGDLYYASSWLATHYFILGEVNGVKLGAANLSRYLAAFNQGHTSPFQFEALIGREIESLNQDLKIYARNSQYAGFRLPVTGYTAGIETYRIGKNAQQLELASVALALGHWQTAQELASNPINGAGKQTLTALGLLARAYSGSKDIDTAALAALRPNMPEGKALQAAALKYVAKNQEKPELLALAKVQAEESLKTLPHNLYAREVLWLDALEAGKLNDAIAQLEIAHQYLPANLNIKLELASLLANRGESARAETLLNKVMLWTHDPDIAAQAASIIKQLEIAK